MIRIDPASRGRLVLVFALAASVAAACGRDATSPFGAPTDLAALSSSTVSGTAGIPLPTPVVVTVTDADRRPVKGAVVTFAITGGLGSTSPAVGTTDGRGQASTTWTLGTAAGANTLVASVDGVDQTILFVATGNAGPATALSVSPKTLRIGATAISGTILAQVVDQFGNSTSASVMLVSRDASKITVDHSGTVQVVQRGSSTYVVSTSGTFRDSTLVVVLSPGDPACTGLPTVGPLTVGQVLTIGFQDQAICVAGGGEYVLSPFFNSAVPSAEVEIDVTGDGVSLPGPLVDAAAARSIRAPPFRAAPRMARDEAFHDRLRTQEERLMPAYAAGARAWYAEGKSGAPGAANASAIPSQVSVGDVISLNVDAVNFCSNPTFRTGRVVAITDQAIVVADTSNPAGGFTDAEYRDFGVTFDTLNYPTDVLNFGAPSDIDGNKHVVMFFTSAVNALSSGGETLGFYYSRDLLPKTGPLGACPGSNVGELFYLVVPAAAGTVSTPLPKAVVAPLISGTVAHEFQHLINASRRLYVNDAVSVTEERWLNEGLSHTAEELNFYASSGLTPGQNLGSIIDSAKYLSAFFAYGQENLIRLNSYLAQTESQGPVGTDDDDADLPTRGAIWSFLRYAADRTTTPASQHNFWFQLVNSQTTGVANLNTVLGSDSKLVMRDWSLATLLDDLIPTAPAYQQPSWNFPQAVPAATAVPYSPVNSNRVLANDTPMDVFLSANGVSYLRFAIAAGGQAYVTTTTSGVPSPSSVLLSLVRTK